MAIALANAVSFADPDLWWHLLAGRTTLRTGHIPMRDTFSYTAFGLPWRHHEWLAETLMALFYGWLGVFGLRILKLLCVGATLLFLVRGMAETRATARIQRAVLIVTAAGLSPQMLFRPQIFSFAALALLFSLLAAETYQDSDQLWMAIPAFALWANLHGGFMVGLAAMVTYAGVAGCVDIWRGNGVQRGAHMAALAVGCILATLVNPFGAGIWFNVMHSVADPLVTAVTEWRPLLTLLAATIRQSRPEGVVFVIPLALFMAFVIFAAMAPDATDAAMVAAAGVIVLGAFYAMRNMALAVIAVAIPLTRHAGLLAAERDKCASSDPGKAATLSGFPPLLAASLAVTLAWTGGSFSNRLQLGSGWPVGAIAFMKAHNLGGDILCRFEWGQYVMWHMAPDSKVFMDGRWDLVYPHGVMDAYIRFADGKPGAQAVLDDPRNQFVLIPPDSAAYRVVRNDPNWKPIYRDATAVLFARSFSPIAQSTGTPATNSVPVAFFP